MSNFKLGLALAAALGLLPGLAAASDRVFVTTPHNAIPMSPRNVAIANCVQRIQDHWPTEARLVLSQRAQLAGDDKQLLRVEGTVWESGERTAVLHECRLGGRGADTALIVREASEVQIAAR